MLKWFKKKEKIIDLGVYEIEDFLDETECNHLIKLIKNNKVPSGVASSEGNYFTVQRTSSTCYFKNNDEIVKNIDLKISKELDIDTKFGEPIQGQLYQVGQEFTDHNDFFQADTYDKYCSESGNRTWTLMIYLNDVTKGGSTDFPRKGISIKPKKGKAVFWNNLLSDGRPDDSMLHAGRPILEGEKFIITKWFRELPYKDANPNAISNTVTKAEFSFGRTDITHFSQLRKFFKKGYAKLEVPPPYFNSIQEVYNEVKNSFVDEYDPSDKLGLGVYISSNQHKIASEISFFSETDQASLLSGIQEFVEDEVQAEIRPTFCYGFRSYKRGSVFKLHRDRLQTHIISVTICIDQDIEKPWSLDIKNHQGKIEKVILDPGQMCIYESARLEHGRLERLKGNFYRTLFLHYVPVN